MNFGDGQDNSVNAWVIPFVHRFSSANFKRLAEFGLHPAQLPVMKILADYGGISLKELSDMLHIKPPTASVMVKRMEKNGLVCKMADLDDQRISRLYLTEKGKGMSSQIAELIRENERLMTEGFSEEELMQLRGYLRRMTANLARAAGEGNTGGCCSKVSAGPGTGR